MIHNNDNFSEQNSKGNPGPIRSSDIERNFQTNSSGSFTFNFETEAFEIRFTGAAYSHNTFTTSVLTEFHL